MSIEQGHAVVYEGDQYLRTPSLLFALLSMVALVRNAVVCVQRKYVLIGRACCRVCAIYIPVV